MSEQNEILYGEGFLRDVRKLPKQVQNKLTGLLGILEKDVFDPRLHTKALSPPLTGKFSFRITHDWRVGFKFISTKMIHLLIADKRDRVYKRLERLK